MNVLSLDPGITTGYAIGRINQSNDEMSVVSGEEKWELIKIWEFLLMGVKPKYIVCERFEFRHGIHKHHGAELFPREIIGICNLYSQMYDCEVKLQPAMKSSPTTFFNDDRLRSLGLFKSGKGHSNDAMRHLLYWAKFKSGSQLVKSYRNGSMD